jgi:hypothetical protein
VLQEPPPQPQPQHEAVFCEAALASPTRTRANAAIASNVFIEPTRNIYIGLPQKGNQFVDASNVIGDARFHRWRHAERLMNRAKL